MYHLVLTLDKQVFLNKITRLTCILWQKNIALILKKNWPWETKVSTWNHKRDNNNKFYLDLCIVAKDIVLIFQTLGHEKQKIKLESEIQYHQITIYVLSLNSIRFIVSEENVFLC